jgi:hypothetical protein
MNKTESSKKAGKIAETDTAKEPGEKAAPEEYYLYEAVKNFEYADHVRIRTTITGVILSFGKFHPQNQKIAVFREVLLPFPVAYSLWQLIKNHMEEVKQFLEQAQEKP